MSISVHNLNELNINYTQTDVSKPLFLLIMVIFCLSLMKIMTFKIAILHQNILIEKFGLMKNMLNVCLKVVISKR